MKRKIYVNFIRNLKGLAFIMERSAISICIGRQAKIHCGKFESENSNRNFCNGKRQ